MAQQFELIKSLWDMLACLYTQIVPRFNPGGRKQSSSGQNEAFVGNDSWYFNHCRRYVFVQHRRHFKARSAIQLAQGLMDTSVFS